VYCSRKCQQDDWHAHKIVCGDDRTRPLLQPLFQASKGRLHMGKDRQLVAVVEVPVGACVMVDASAVTFFPDDLFGISELFTAAPLAACAVSDVAQLDACRTVAQFFDVCNLNTLRVVDHLFQRTVQHVAILPEVLAAAASLKDAEVKGGLFVRVPPALFCRDELQKASRATEVQVRTMRLLMHHQFHLGGAMLELRKQFVDVPPADKLAAMARLLQELELSFFKTDDDASASFMPWCKATLFQPLAVFLAHAFAVSGTRLKMLVPLVAAAGRCGHDPANAVCVPTGTTEASVFVTRPIARGERVVITTRPSRRTDASRLLAASEAQLEKASALRRTLLALAQDTMDTTRDSVHRAREQCGRDAYDAMWARLA